MSPFYLIALLLLAYILLWAARIRTQCWRHEAWAAIRREMAGRKGE